MHRSSPLIPNLTYRRRFNLAGETVAGLAACVGLAILTFGAAVGAYWWWSSGPAVSKTGCYALLDVAIELSDPADALQLQRIHDRLDRVPAESCIGTRVMVHQFNPAKEEPMRELFDAIDPGKYSEHSTLSKTRLEAEDERKDQLLEPMRAQFLRALVPDTRPESFLIQGLSYLSRSRRWQGDNPDGRKKLVLVTDFLENSPACSFYKAVRQKPVALASRCRAILQENPILLRGADVEVLLIRRRPAKDGTNLQPAELREFYEDWFRRAGARNVVTQEIP